MGQRLARVLRGCEGNPLCSLGTVARFFLAAGRPAGQERAPLFEGQPRGLCNSPDAASARRFVAPSACAAAPGAKRREGARQACARGGRGVRRGCPRSTFTAPARTPRGLPLPAADAQRGHQASGRCALIYAGRLNFGGEVAGCSAGPRQRGEEKRMGSSGETEQSLGFCVLFLFFPRQLSSSSA